LVTGCSLNENLSSSFNKRKYTSGIFSDLPAKKPSIETSQEFLHANKNILSVGRSNPDRVEYVPLKEQKQILTDTKVAQPSSRENIKQVHKIMPTIERLKESKSIKTTAKLNEGAKNAPENKPLLMIGEILYLLGIILGCIWLLTGISQGLFLALACILYVLGIIFLIKSHPQPGHFFFNYGVTGFIMAIICVSWLFAIPHLNNPNDLNGSNEPFQLKVVSALVPWILLSVFYSIEAFIKSGKQYKGLAIAAIIIAIGVLAISFLLHYL
jgi:hypothetical protein